MKLYATLILATLLAMNIAFMVTADLRFHLLKQSHAEQADRHNFTRAVNQALPEQTDFPSYKYHAFIGWKAGERHTDNFNIDASGTRKTSGNPQQYDEKLMLFGGSTAWGYGLPDRYTLPSSLQKLLPRTFVINKAETSYNATQELNSLLISLAKNEISKGSIIFYDGVNEIYHSCELGTDVYGHGRVEQIRKALDEKPDVRTLDFLDTLLLKYSRKTAQALKGKLARRAMAGNKAKLSPCARDPQRAWAVARRIVTSWQAAAAIAAQKGLRFHAILQPDPYSDPALVPHFYSPHFAQGTKAVYPKIVALAKDKSWFADGRKWFAGKDYYFDDCCHVNEHGNALLARKIYEIVSKDKKPLRTNTGKSS